MTDRHLIAIDFDGTLLNPMGEVSPATREAVHAVVEAGHEVVFATGRNRWESLKVLDAVEHHASAVFVAGAITFDLEKHETIDRRPMGATTAAAVCRLLDDAGLQCLILQDREVAGVDFLHGPVPPPDRVREWHRLHNLVVRDIPDVADIHAANHAQTLRVSTLGPPEVLDPIERQLLDGAVGDVTAYQVDLANFGVRLLEVFGPRVSKWTAVARLADRLGIGPDRIVAIGDDMNDLEMISRAGQGVAMGNGREAIKRAAGRTIGSNADDGLAGFLREFA